MFRLISLLFLSAIVMNAASPILAQTDDAPPSADQFRAAYDYSESTGGDALLVMHNGEIIYEAYGDDYSADEPHLLASGSKSFSCSLAVAAIEDGLLEGFDQPIVDVIPEFDDTNADKAAITLRDVLSLSSGLETPAELSRGVQNVDLYARAIEIDPIAEPGEDFIYGAINYHIFGEMLNRALAESGESLLDYLDRRILDPIGSTVNFWVTDVIGNPQLAGGALMTADDWGRYGQLILQRGMWEGEQLLDETLLAECFLPSDANLGYGMTWWLNYSGVEYATELGVSAGETDVPFVMAAGAGNQRLYIVPSRNVVVVRFANRDRQFNDGEMINTLLGE